MTHLVLIIVLATAAVQSGACPTMCTCDNYPHDNLKSSVAYYTSVRCETFFENFTNQLEDTTDDLTFSNLNENQLQTIIENLLEAEIRLPYLAQLTITRSVVPDLINLTFSGFPRLRSINLSANKITTIPDSFINITSLQNLDLSNNTINMIDNDPFRTFQNLEKLNLSANFINVLAPSSFSGLDALKYLDLSLNNLTFLEDKVFTPLLSLQYLNMSNNRLEILNAKYFSSLVKLQHLDVSWNRLIRVELGSLQLPSLARLLLVGNPKLGMSREPSLLVGTGQRLQTVDASRIGLKQVPAALTHSIRTLRLGGNSIKTVRCGDLDSYPLLQLLDFNSNNLEVIEDDALGRLDSLSILYINDNSMKEIPKSLSEKLKVLHLERNEIEKIGDRDLQGLTNLEVLLLNDNNIRVIEEEAFNQLNSLVTLDISRNPIKVLDAGCLSGPMTLQVLRMSNIGVISPAKEVSFPLSSTEHLITLDLSGSPGLARQLLVDTAALAASRELQELDLSFTDLDFIRSDLLHFLPQLRTFHIQGNRINCVQLEWLAAWMRRQDEQEYRKITCTNPPELWGTPLIDLQDTEISASKYTRTTPKMSTGKKNTDRIQNEINAKIFALTAKELDNDKKPTLQTAIVKPNARSKQNVTNFEEKGADKQENTTKTEDKSFVTTISSALEHTTMRSHLESLPLTNANEPQESLHNKLDRESGKTEISHNLFIASKEKTFNSTPHAPEKHNNKLNELFPTVASVTLDVDVNSNSSHEHRWNASTGEMSMFSADHQRRRRGLLHPGMLILAAGILGATAALTMLAARFTRRRRATMRLRQQEDLEVSSLPGMTELW